MNIETHRRYRDIYGQYWVPRFDPHDGYWKVWNKDTGMGLWDDGRNLQAI